jgi:hypothetical protein
MSRPSLTSRSPPPRSVTVTAAKFIAGEPMKPATNGWPGVVELERLADLLHQPSFMTTTRSPSVIASTWSWVT